jgi:two-component system nitrogen regulation response regulator GlnG
MGAGGEDARPAPGHDAAVRGTGAGEEAFDRLVSQILPSVVDAALAAGRPLLYRRILARVERPLLRHVLARCGGNQLRAARLLGVNRNTLRKRLRTLGLLPPRPAPDRHPA